MKIPTLFLCFVPALALAADEPFLEWRFDGKDVAGEWLGKKEQREAGPRSPRYPTFESENDSGLFLNGENWILLKDKERGGKTDIRFGAGDSITVETWIKAKSLGKGEMAYVLGKGRHGKLGADLGEMNQNYAVRLKGTGSGAQIGFLFTSEHPETKKRDWHRWWSDSSFTQSGWHHIALVYTYGQKGSLRAYIDGKKVAGTWDMGGDTDLPPVNDADDLVIGTGYRRSSGESFSGWLDNLAIYRTALDEKELTTRYEYSVPPIPVTREMLPKGEVLLQISEAGVPEANSWPEEPIASEIYRYRAFGFFDWPQKYISTGVRADRANPSHFRASAMIRFPRGTHRLLLRGRGACRLYIDGEKILDFPFPSRGSDGHGELTDQDDYLDLGPDFRFAPPGNQEKWVEWTTDGGEQLVVMETMVGSLVGKNKRRPEFGETVVAISPEGEESWYLLSPSGETLPYTDEGWAAYESERRDWLASVNAAARAVRRAESAPYWAVRRKAASDWLEKTKGPVVPEVPNTYPVNNEIDHFVAAKIEQAKEASLAAKGGSVDYFEEVNPLLEEHCYGCHQGGKAKGDLRLDVRGAALAGGKSDGPAVVPGDEKASSLLFRIGHDAEDDIMPPKGDPLPDEAIAILTTWIKEGAVWPQFDVKSFDMTPLSEDLAFLRRLTLDTVGVVPSEEEIGQFLSDGEDVRRSKAIDRLLDDSRWADRWMGYWQDVLAENPNIINPTLNNTGPFRWWIYESLLDNKPADLMVTELIRMEGSERFGGPAGFQTASQNDVPMAAKGIIVGTAFLGVEMKCARCHDAPSHRSKQEDLFQLAALLAEKPLEVPTTSSVPMDQIHKGGRKPLIEVTLKPGSKVEPVWPFEDFVEEKVAVTLAKDPEDPRDRLAALVTAPQNERFAQVLVNRIWERLMGRGIVENVSDWEKGEPSHPDLLKWLGRELVASGYDMKAVARLIFESHAYQRANDPLLTETSPLFLSPAPRRLEAEQIVDSLFSATGKPFEVEEVSLDIDSVRALSQSISLGKPRRAWMLASTSNERDRPSLSLPRIQAVSSVMQSFGWRGARQDPVSTRDVDPNVLQPAILANGVMGNWLTRLSDDHGVTEMALEEQTVEELVDRLFLRMLTREPSQHEKDRYVALLSKGYDDRVVPEDGIAKSPEEKREPRKYISWSNHLSRDANSLAQKREEQARRGDPPTKRLEDDWRQRLEDVVWAMINAPEWIYTP